MIIKKELKKLLYWKKKGEDRGIPYSIEELLLKHKRNKWIIFIATFLLVPSVLVLTTCFYIYIWEVFFR